MNQTQPCYDNLHARVLSYFSAYKDLGNCNFRLTLAVQKANISCSSYYFFPGKRGFLDYHISVIGARLMIKTLVFLFSRTLDPL